MSVKILLVDDDQTIIDALKTIFKREYGEHVDIHTATTFIEASTKLKEQKNSGGFDLVTCDLNLKDPKYNGTHLMHFAKDRKVCRDFVVLTGLGGGLPGDDDTSSAGLEDAESKRIIIESLINIDEYFKGGRNCFIRKALSPQDTADRIVRNIGLMGMGSFSKTGPEKQSQKVSGTYSKIRLIGQSPVFEKALNNAKLVAPFDSSVLLLGESGVGKELFAETIHNQSQRKDGPFIAINCAAIPAELIESELFGHKKGAFTGATENKKGKFELAHKGTLFLDEIGEMPLALQVKLLRALQEEKVTPVGETEPVGVDVRIISATNKNLRQEIDKTFRKDLFYRLAVFPIRIPSLKERGFADLLLIARYLLSEKSKEFKKEKITLGTQAMVALTEYPFPGNVRELENVIERLLIFSQSDQLEITASDVSKALALDDQVGSSVDPSSTALTFSADTDDVEDDVLDSFVESIRLIEERGNRLNNANIMKTFGTIHPDKKNKKRTMKVDPEKIFEDAEGTKWTEIEDVNGDQKKLPVVFEETMTAGNKETIAVVNADYFDVPMSGQNLSSYIGNQRVRKSTHYMKIIARNPKKYACLLKVKAFADYYLINQNALKLPPMDELRSFRDS